MGMYDRLYDAKGFEWQTKAYECELVRYWIGDRIGDRPSHQVEILGGPFSSPYAKSFATVRDGVLESVDDPRDESLPLVDYRGQGLNADAVDEGREA